MASPLIFHHSPGPSFLHRIDPRWKLVVYLLVSLFSMVGPGLSLAILAFITLALYTLSYLNPFSLLKEACPLWVMAAILLVFRTLSLGWDQGVLETVRFVFLVFWTHLFLASTSNGEIRKAVEFLLQFLPGKRGKRIGLTLSITLLLFPLLLDLSREILDAMALRKFGARRSFQFLTRRFILTFLRKAFRVASHLAQALEVRGFP